MHNPASARPHYSHPYSNLLNPPSFYAVYFVFHFNTSHYRSLNIAIFSSSLSLSVSIFITITSPYSLFAPASCFPAYTGNRTSRNGCHGHKNQGKNQGPLVANLLYAPITIISYSPISFSLTHQIPSLVFHQSPTIVRTNLILSYSESGVRVGEGLRECLEWRVGGGSTIATFSCVPSSRIALGSRLLHCCQRRIQPHHSSWYNRFFFLPYTKPTPHRVPNILFVTLLHHSDDRELMKPGHLQTSSKIGTFSIYS